MAVSDEIREQRQKLKGQGFKAHWDYFWEYYKIHTLVVVLVIIFGVLTARDILNEKEHALYCTMINSGASDAQEDAQNKYLEYAGIDSEVYDVLIDMSSIYRTDVIDEMTMATSQKIMAVISAKELDVLAADESTFYFYGNQGTFLDLRDIFSQEELDALGDKVFYIDGGYVEYIASDAYETYIMNGEYDKNNKYAVRAAKAYETGEYERIPKEDMDDPLPMGIIFSDSEFVSETGAYPVSVPIIGIVNNTERLDEAVNFLKYVIK